MWRWHAKKVCKQGRDDIKVKAGKYTKPYPTSFVLYSSVKEMYGGGLVYSPCFYLISNAFIYLYGLPHSAAIKFHNIT